MNPDTKMGEIILDKEEQILAQNKHRKSPYNIKLSVANQHLIQKHGLLGRGMC